jgi:hypothetical protein
MEGFPTSFTQQTGQTNWMSLGMAWGLSTGAAVYCGSGFREWSLSIDVIFPTCTLKASN